MRITVSGLPGSGTTSFSRHIANQYGFKLVSAGEVFRAMAAERGLDLAEFGRLAKQDRSIDISIDERQKEIAEISDEIILEGRLSGYFIPDADLRIWLSASLSCRVERIRSRDLLDDKTISQRLTLERENCEASRYMEYYSIDIHDLSIYDIVLSSEKFGVEDLGEIVGVAIKRIREN